ncbi:MAG: SGNH/GDSL hydrolase family protein [Clostridia bacterium]|nr:SGNH/GDSL hydrolase family protein [Clostridia bacterium]
MILTNEQLRSTLSGAAEIVEKDGKLVPYRYGKHVRDVIYPEGNGYHGAMFHTSGVISRFVTDSKTLTFSWVSVPAGGGHTFDVWADGVMYAHIGCGAGQGTLETRLPEGSKTVEIYFPHHSAGQIYDVTLEEGATFENAPARKYKILFIGDSITHGSTSTYASMTYAHQVARMLDAELVNQGIGGERFNPMAVDDEMDFFRPDLVSVAYGTNDWSHSSSHGRMVGAANGHFARLRDKYPDIPIVAILPLWRADMGRVTAVGTFEDMRTIIREAAARFDVTVVDGMELVPHVTSVYADQRLHPNTFGFQFYADNLLPHFEKLLKK